jgi:thioredoxin-related protein
VASWLENSQSGDDNTFIKLGGLSFHTSIDTFKQKNVANALGVRSTPFMIFFTKDSEEKIVKKYQEYPDISQMMSSW